MATQKEEKNDISSKFVRHQSLRFMFIDEVSTASLDVFADIHHFTSTHIRERGTWSLRSRNIKRPFGGLNVVTSGDTWQFGPIGSSGAVFDNPLMLKKLSSVERIASMFWTRETDSFNKFLELTIEHRCKDPWLSYVLRGVRHGCLDEESFCFYMVSQRNTRGVGIHRKTMFSVERKRVKSYLHHGGKKFIWECLEMHTGSGDEVKNAMNAQTSAKEDVASSTVATCRLPWKKINASLLHHTFTHLMNQSIMLLRFELYGSACK